VTEDSPTPDWWGLLETGPDALGGGYDEPMRRLVAVARKTRLHKLHPFTSMNRLCFARTPWPFEDVQPGYVAFYPDGKYEVWRGGPYKDQSTCVLRTHDSAAAIATLLQQILGEETTA